MHEPKSPCLRTIRGGRGAQCAPAGGTSVVPLRHGRINGLLEEGFTKAEIARRMGYSSPAIQFRRTRITARNALRVQRLEILGTLVEVD